MRIQTLTNFFLRIEVATSSLERNNERASQMSGLIDKAISVLASAPSHVIVAASGSSNNNSNNSVTSTASTSTTSNLVSSIITSPVRTFSLFGVWSSLGDICSPELKRTFREENEQMSSSNLFSSSARRSPKAKAAAILLGESLQDRLSLEKLIRDRRRKIHHHNDNNDNTLDDDPSLIFLELETATNDLYNFLSVRRRLFEYRIAVLRFSVSAFLDICAIAACQTMTLPLKIPPIHEKIGTPTAVALVAFRPAVLFVQFFSSVAIEVRELRVVMMRRSKTTEMKEEEIFDKDDDCETPEKQKRNEIQEQNEKKQEEEQDSFADIISTQVLPAADNIICGICDIVSSALSRSGFLGPSLLKAWWNYFIRKLEPQLLLRELEKIDRALTDDNNNNENEGETTTTMNFSVLGDTHLIRKLYPELPLLQALASLFILDDDDIEKNEKHQKSEALLQKAVGFCNQGLSIAKELRECSAGWIASRGSRACCLALLIRSEVQRRLGRTSTALEDTKSAVFIDEGAKVFSGEILNAKTNSKVIYSMVIEFAPALFPASFGTDIIYASLFGEKNDIGNKFFEQQQMNSSSASSSSSSKKKNSFNNNLIASDPFSQAHASVVSSSSCTNNKKELQVVFDLTTMLALIHQSASSAKNSHLNFENFSSSSSSSFSNKNNNKSSCCGFPWSNDTAAISIQRSLNELLPIPSDCWESALAHYTTNFSSSNRSSPNSSPHSSRRSNNHYQNNNDTNTNFFEAIHLDNDDDDENDFFVQADDEGYLPPAEFSVSCPSVIERVSWLCEPFDESCNNNEKKSSEERKTTVCLGKKFWGSSKVQCKSEMVSEEFDFGIEKFKQNLSSSSSSSSKQQQQKQQQQQKYQPHQKMTSTITKPPLAQKRRTSVSSTTTTNSTFSSVSSAPSTIAAKSTTRPSSAILRIRKEVHAARSQTPNLPSSTTKNSKNITNNANNNNTGQTRKITPVLLQQQAKNEETASTTQEKPGSNRLMTFVEFCRVTKTQGEGGETASDSSASSSTSTTPLPRPPSTSSSSSVGNSSVAAASAASSSTSTGTSTKTTTTTTNSFRAPTPPLRTVKSFNVIVAGGRKTPSPSNQFHRSNNSSMNNNKISSSSTSSNSSLKKQEHCENNINTPTKLRRSNSTTNSSSAANNNTSTSTPTRDQMVKSFFARAAGKINKTEEKK